MPRGKARSRANGVDGAGASSSEALDSDASAAVNRHAGQRPSGASPGSERPQTEQLSTWYIGGPPIARFSLDREANPAEGNRPDRVVSRSRAERGEEVADLVVDFPVAIAVDRPRDLLTD